MTQEQFQELSVSEVKQLNAMENNDDVTDAWRAGYIYAQEIIKKSFEEDTHNIFLDKVEEFISDDLDPFEAW